MEITATYSREDNKLRIRADERLDAETYARVHDAGFIWAPVQKVFVAGMWTPERADLCVEFAGVIDDEDIPLAERAAERALRFEGYHERRSDDAERAREHVESIAGNLPLGQPIHVGHASGRKAEREAERLKAGMQRAVDLWETAQYWERRAEGVMRHANYKADPRVRARRVHTLEADKRRHERTAKEFATYAGWWGKVAACEDSAVQLALALKVATAHYSSGRWDLLKRGEALPAQVAKEAIESCTRVQATEARWIAHINLRLAYERVLLGRRPDEEIKPSRKRRGAAALPLLNYEKTPIEVQNRWQKGVTESFRQVPMTGDEYQRIHEDSRGTRVSADGTHRVRITVIGQRGFVGGEWVCVLLTDSKKHPVPVAKPKAPEPAEQPVPTLDEEPADEEPVDEEPGDAFARMRASLKAGVKAVAVPELFPTPRDLAVRIGNEARIHVGDDVLEPNGGLGALAQVARQHGGNVFCVEIAPAAIQALEAQGFAVLMGDFLTVDLDGRTFDRVVMNPPFSAELAHVMRAWSLLRPGGRLVAVMSASAKHRKLTKKDRELFADGAKGLETFRDFVEQHGDMEDLPVDTFRVSGTGVHTVLVNMVKD